MKRIAVTITEEQSERLSREAHRRRVSVSELVRENLDASNEEHPRVPGFLDWPTKTCRTTSQELMKISTRRSAVREQCRPAHIGSFTILPE